MAKLGNIAKKMLYGKIKDIGVVKGIGFIPNDEYYIDEHTYLFGFKLKSTRYWDEEEYKAKKVKKRDRAIVKGYRKEKGVD